jgi:hypothetical protein
VFAQFSRLFVGLERSEAEYAECGFCRHLWKNQSNWLNPLQATRRAAELRSRALLFSPFRNAYQPTRAPLTTTPAATWAVRYE